MSWYYWLQLALTVACVVVLPEFAIMAYAKHKEPHRIKEIQRITKWLNYQMFGCGVLIGLVIKLSWS